MKKQILSFGVFMSFCYGFSQNTFPTAVNTAVGIGTGTTAVSGAGGLRLKVTSGTSGNSGIQLTNVTSSTATVTGNNKALSVDATGKIILTPVLNIAPTITNIYNSDGVLTTNRIINLNSNNLTFNPSNSNSQFFVNGLNGNVGIGNILPTSKLDVTGDIKSNSIYLNKNLSNGQTFSSWADCFSKCRLIGAGFDSASEPLFEFNDFPISNFHDKPLVWLGIEDKNDKRRFGHYAYATGKSFFELFDKNQELHFTVKEDENIVTMLLPKQDSYFGIGTSNFTDGTDTYRLSVKGAIRAERVKVYTTWADFVFEKDYNLPTLEDVEKHIQENGHLKDIPSAKDVENNGIELGEMNKKLLQKVEELTLYLIEMNKEIKDLKEQLNKK